MNDFVKAAGMNELQDGTMKMVSIAGRQYLLARVAGKYYAADNSCPHMGGNLSSGQLNGTIVTCPRHFSQFDLTDGHNVRWTNWTGLMLGMAKMFRSPRPLKTYPVKLEGDSVLISRGKVPAAAA